MSTMLDAEARRRIRRDLDRGSGDPGPPRPGRAGTRWRAEAVAWLAWLTLGLLLLWLAARYAR